MVQLLSRSVVDASVEVSKNRQIRALNTRHPGLKIQQDVISPDNDTRKDNRDELRNGAARNNLILDQPVRFRHFRVRLKESMDNNDSILKPTSTNKYRHSEIFITLPDIRNFLRCAHWQFRLHNNSLTNSEQIPLH